MADLPVSWDPLTPLAFLERTVRVFPEKTALVYGDLRWTYAELAEQVGRFAGALLRAGVAPGDRVAVLAPNVPVLLAAHFAVLRARAALVAINTRLAPDEVGYILNHSGARVVLVDPELASKVSGVPEPLRGSPLLVNLEDPVAGVTGSPLEGPSWAEFVEGAEVLPVAGGVDDEERITSISYTSGTTGRPKGVMYTHRGTYLNALGELVAHKLERDSVFLWSLPLFHCNGWCFPWAVTAAGGTHVMLRGVEPRRMFELIAAERVTHFNGAPTVLLMLAEAPEARGVRFDPEVRVATGGSPPSPTLLARMEELGVIVTHLYGLTETYGPHVYCEMQPGWERLDVEGRAALMARQGVPYHVATHLRVVDAEMRDVPADGETMGEVVMRGNNVMKGYFDDPEATSEAFDGGWLHSGDLGVVHPDGYIELRDRKKDIIISGGENISTIEVEHTIVKHPAVLECAVVASPHEKWGEVPKAFVALKPGERLTEQGLIDFCRERLAHFKCPKAVDFTELPKTSTGKIQKFLLREREWAGVEKRIQ
ncbi:MAG: long-chain-fatty-acid--CoA ligase [Deltaproteobacteria bacterium]|nr:long-chain-fatty-acid--CoA ligase [Deltaproteobacteria bacterium]